LQEAEAHGLTPRAAGDAIRGLTDKVADVAEAAGKSLKEQVLPGMPDTARGSMRRAGQRNEGLIAVHEAAEGRACRIRRQERRRR